MNESLNESVAISYQTVGDCFHFKSLKSKSENVWDLRKYQVFVDIL